MSNLSFFRRSKLSYLLSPLHIGDIMDKEKKIEKEEKEQQRKYLKEKKEIIRDRARENSAENAGQAEDETVEGGYEHSE